MTSIAASVPGWDKVKDLFNGGTKPHEGALQFGAAGAVAGGVGSAVTWTTARHLLEAKWPTEQSFVKTVGRSTGVGALVLAELAALSAMKPQDDWLTSAYVGAGVGSAAAVGGALGVTAITQPQLLKSGAKVRDIGLSAAAVGMGLYSMIQAGRSLSANPGQNI